MAGNLVIVRGLPGSGKSTFAKSYMWRDFIHIEADMYFTNEKGEYVFDGTLLHDAHEWCLMTTRHFIRRGSNVIVSNTFSRRWEFQPYLDIEAAKCFVITMNGRYQNIHGVPDDVIEKMRERWEDF